MADQILPQDFYVYLHRKASTGEVFYCGKGNAHRAWSNFGRSIHWKNIVKKHGYTIEILQDGLLEWAALELECQTIALYGRKDLGQGTLINLTDGGEGVSGFVASEELKKRIALAISKAKKGIHLTEAQYQAIWGDEARQKRIASMRLQASTPEAKAKRAKATSISKKNKPITKNHRENLLKAFAKKDVIERKRKATNAKKIICTQTNIVFETTYCAEKWLLSNGFDQANASTIWKALNNKLKTAYGYTWRYLDKMPQTA
jgi:hypothetical protein